MYRDKILFVSLSGILSPGSFNVMWIISYFSRITHILKKIELGAIMKRISGIGFLAFIIMVSGCSKDPAASDNALQIDPVLTEQAALGWELNEMVTTGSDLEDLAGGTSPSVDQEITGLAGAQKLKALAHEMLIRSQNVLPGYIDIHKPMVDSLYFFYEDTIRGMRSALYFDETTSLARYYEVRYKFQLWQTLRYDSAEIIVNLNFTPEDDQDDFLHSAIRLQLFKPYFILQSISSTLLVTDHSAQEITGFEATVDSYYHETRPLLHLVQLLKINPDRSGTISENYEFRDNTTSSSTIIFNADYTGTFSRAFRDGTTVNGSFNSIEDDLKGSFSETVDFPEGRYIDKITKEATVALTIMEPAHILNAALTRSTFFSSGAVRTAVLEMEATEEPASTVVTYKLTKGNGAYGTFTLHSNEFESTLDGEWNTFSGDYYILISAEYFVDGSGHLSYQVYPTPYTPGDDPVLTAEYFFSPDGHGDGTIFYQGETYLITFDRQDEARIQEGERSARIRLYYE